MCRVFYYKVYDAIRCLREIKICKISDFDSEMTICSTTYSSKASFWSLYVPVEWGY